MPESKNPIEEITPMAEALEAPAEETEEVEAAEETEETEAPHERELTALREEVARLQVALAEKDRLYEAELARAREQAEFSLLFPDVPPTELPDEVRKEAEEKNLPLAAAFALYEKKREAEERRTRAVNHRNARQSAGRAGQGGTEEFFTPEDVRRMSPAEVRAHFNTIKESMKKWN